MAAVVIVYFNEARTDYLVFGPYTSVEAAEEAYLHRISKRWPDNRQVFYEVASVFGERK